MAIPVIEALRESKRVAHFANVRLGRASGPPRNYSDEELALEVARERASMSESGRYDIITRIAAAANKYRR